VDSARELGLAAGLLRDVGEVQAGTVLAVGFPHHNTDLLRSGRIGRRILWYGENLPPPGRSDLATLLYRRLPSGRLLDASMHALSIGGRRSVDGRLLRWRSRASVEREWHRNAQELAATAAHFDRIVMTSGDRAASAAELGIPASVSPFGYHPVMAGRITDAGVGHRDIEVLILGRDYDPRTRRGVDGSGVISSLRRSGSVTVVQGNLFGPERAQLLQRTKLVLDIHRVPGNASGLRFILATAAGAALVSEPSHDPSPAVPGIHYEEAALGDLAAVARQLASDEPRRRRMVEASQALITGPLAMWPRIEAALDGSG
jgi:hypothetical protein